MISKSIFVVVALVGLALPTAAGGGILQPAAAQEFSIAEILDLALDFADLDLDETEDGGGAGAGDGGDGSQQQVDANVQQQDSTQDRTQGETNVNQNIQSKVQRQSEQIVTEDGDTVG
jgi:hypothetical protein